MLLSKVIELYQEKLKEHGDHHVLVGADDDYQVSGIKFDSQTKVFLTEEKDVDGEEDEIIIYCDDCRRVNKSDILQIGLYDYVCKECYENDHGYQIYSDYVVQFMKDENGYYSKRRVAVEKGLRYYCKKCGEYICKCEED